MVFVWRRRVDDDLEEIKRQEAIYGFAPISTEAPLGRDADLYDILITTDVLAKGKDRGVFSVPPWGTELIYVSCPLMTHGAPEELRMRLSANSVRVSE